MFELSVALKYLLPRWRQLSVSIISLISILVISLVVWLIVVFLSVTHGLEKMWTQKLIALTAPIRITPTNTYYRSYYYQVDGISSHSDFTYKTIREKLAAEKSDPYDPDEDEEIPISWLAADRSEEGTLNDPVKKAFELLQKMGHVAGLRVKDYEITGGTLQLNLVRNAAQLPKDAVRSVDDANYVQSTVSQVAWLGSFDSQQLNLLKALLPVDSKDLNNILEMSNFADVQADDKDQLLFGVPNLVKKRIENFFKQVTIRTLKTSQHGWKIPLRLFPQEGRYDVHVELIQGSPFRIWLSREKNKKQPTADQVGKVVPGQLRISSEKEQKQLFLSMGSSEITLSDHVPIFLEGDVEFPAQINSTNVFKTSDILFKVDIPVQGTHLIGIVPLENLKIGNADFSNTFENSPSEVPSWLYVTKEQGKVQLNLPRFSSGAEGVLLPKSFKEGGVLIGDEGNLVYMSPTASSVQEQLIPIFVAGFYDPGIIPIGGKFVLVNEEITGLIRSAQNQDDLLSSNGINVNFDKITDAQQIKAEIQKAFSEANIAPYWKIETFREYEFTKDLIQQLGTERTLWSLIATVIIIVACSNIISMLIILVNDKKLEIGILRSMGASSLSIASIFGFCGVVMGLAGSFIGVTLAWFTLKNLQVLVNLISRVQGYQAFNPTFFGNSLPNEMSMDALLFVFVTTVIISILAGIVPALKASMLRPSAILRSE